MTDKPEQRSVTLVNNLRGYAQGMIDEMLRSLDDSSEQLEQAFMAELAHLDDLFTDQENDDTELEQVQRFDKGYARTMAAIQAATERLVEAQAHITRITNTIEFHPAFSGNGCSQRKDQPGKLAPLPTIYRIGPVTSDKHYPVSWLAIQELMNEHWPFSDIDRIWAPGKTIIVSSYWQCLASKIDARAVVNLTVTEDDWSIETQELTAKVNGTWVDYLPVEVEVDDKIYLSIAPHDCFTQEPATKENDHE